MIITTTSVTVLRRISATVIKGLGANRSDNREIATIPRRNRNLTSVRRTINRYFGLLIIIKCQIAATAIPGRSVIGRRQNSISRMHG